MENEAALMELWDVNASSAPSREELRAAMKRGSMRRVKELIEGGGWLDLNTNDDALALYDAAKARHESTVRLVVDEFFLRRPRATIFRYYIALLNVAKTHNLELLDRFLLERGIASGDRVSLDLVRAARDGNERDARLSVLRGAKINFACHDMTPLMYACFHGHVRVARVLLELGASVECIGAGRGERRTPLSYATEIGHRRIMALLVGHGARIDAEQGIALASAIRQNQSKAVMWLLSRGADPHVVTSEGRNVLFSVLENPFLVQKMIDLGVDVNLVASDGGETALQLACANATNGDWNGPDVVELLLRAGADPVKSNTFPEKAALVTILKRCRSWTSAQISAAKRFAEPEVREPTEEERAATRRTGCKPGSWQAELMLRMLLRARIRSIEPFVQEARAPAALPTGRKHNLARSWRRLPQALQTEVLKRAFGGTVKLFEGDATDAQDERRKGKREPKKKTGKRSGRKRGRSELGQ